MAVSMVSDPESEQELVESHLMLKNDCLCFRTSSSFVGNNPSLQIQSFTEDRRKCNQTGNPSISDFSTILTSDILILADCSHLPSDEAYRQCLSLPSNHLSMPCYECKPNARHFFDEIFIKAWFCWGRTCLFCHMTSVGWLEIIIQHTIHYLWLSLPCRFQAWYSFPSYLLIPASELSGDRWVHSY